ncbi:MAG: lysostaphin resistance A-like protein [Actinomycetota bacterium]|nr:CPBP family intramembrane metalloprotease [Actinomycetota bacterium]
MAREVAVSRSAVDRAWPSFAAAGFALLLARQAVAPSFLPFIYGWILVGAFVLARGSDDAGNVHPALVLVAGVSALFAARAATGIGIPVRSGANAVFMNLLAAIAEEMFFRRYLYAKVARRGHALAIIVTALLFALIHVPAYGTAAFPVDLGAGLLLSWQRWASGRWEMPAVTHATANLLVMMR